MKMWRQGHLSPSGLQTQSRWKTFLYYSDFITFASRSSKFIQRSSILENKGGKSRLLFPKPQASCSFQSKQTKLKKTVLSHRYLPFLYLKTAFLQAVCGVTYNIKYKIEKKVPLNILRWFQIISGLEDTPAACTRVMRLPSTKGK